MVNLEHYTGIKREGKIITFENMLNEYEYPSIQEAERFEKLYNILAVEALLKMEDIIEKRHIVHPKDGKKLSESELAFHAKRYYMGGGITIVGAALGPSRSDVLEKAEKLYDLSKDIRAMQKAGLIGKID